MDSMNEYAISTTYLQVDIYPKYRCTALMYNYAKCDKCTLILGVASAW